MGREELNEIERLRLEVEELKLHRRKDVGEVVCKNADLRMALKSANQRIEELEGQRKEQIKVHADFMNEIHEPMRTGFEELRAVLIEFDAWLSFRGEYYEVLTAFRNAFGSFYRDGVREK